MCIHLILYYHCIIGIGLSQDINFQKFQFTDYNIHTQHMHNQLNQLNLLYNTLIMVCTNIPKPENLRILKIITSLNITTFSLSKCLHIIVSLLSLHVFYINEYLILIFIFILYNTINLIVLPIIISVDRFSDAIPIYLILYIHTSRFLITLSTQSLLNNLFTATIIIHFTTIRHRYIKSKFVYSFSYSNSFVNSLSEFLLSYTTSITLSAGLYEFNIDTYHYIQFLLHWICSNT
eukprot:421153_1